LSARWGRGWGWPVPTSFLLRERLESIEGRAEDERAAGAAGMGALIWRGALMVGGPFFLDLSPRFLRREMPFCFSDMLA
jgi:hypothetical protein